MCRFEETHKYFAKDMYELTAKITKDLDGQLFNAAVYLDQVSHLSYMVRQYIVIIPC